MEPPSPDHPCVALLFALEGEPTVEQVQAVRAWATRVQTARNWAIATPAFVDEFDEDGVHTLGLVTSVLSGFPPWGERIPVDVDRLQLEDVRSLVSEAEALSAAVDETVIVEYDGEAIGWIRQGRADDGVARAFLDEWRRSLEHRSAPPPACSASTSPQSTSR